MGRFSISSNHLIGFCFFMLVSQVGCNSSIEKYVADAIGASKVGDEATVGEIIATTTTTTTTTTTVPPISCPSNYVLVPALAGYTSSSFCVSKYEMKLQYDGNLIADGNVTNALNYDLDYDTLSERAKYVAVSTAAGRPWVQIKRGENGGSSGQGAIEACQALGAQYDLISLGEWQSIARNIEGVASNWSQGVVGNSGGLTRGHSEGGPSQSIEADTDDNNGCFQKSQTNCTTNTHADFSQRRTFNLSNGNVVWDFSGNVYEWVKDNNSTSQGPNGYISQAVDGGGNTNAKTNFGPAGDYSALGSTPYGGLGYGSLNSSGGAIRRGGYWTDLVDAGIFRTSLSSAPTVLLNNLGFRCVHHP